MNALYQINPWIRKTLALVMGVGKMLPNVEVYDKLNEWSAIPIEEDTIKLSRDKLTCISNNHILLRFNNELAKLRGTSI